MVQSLLKALHILTLFDQETPEMRLKDLCTLSKMSASTVSRMLRTFEAMGFVAQNPVNGMYRLGPAAFVVGANVADMNRFADVSLSYISKISAKYDASAHVATERNGRVLFLGKIEQSSTVARTHPRSRHHELHLTSVGKSILAFSHPKRQDWLIQGIEFKPVTPHSITSRLALQNELKLVRRRGYAVAKCESRENLYSFGAPILNSDGTAIGAISISLESSRYPEAAAGIIRDVRCSAGEISAIISKGPSRF